MWSVWLAVCDCSFSLSALWSPLSVPTILIGFHLPWTWGLSSWLLQQSAAAAPYLGLSCPSILVLCQHTCACVSVHTLTRGHLRSQRFSLHYNYSLEDGREVFTLIMQLPWLKYTSITLYLLSFFTLSSCFLCETDHRPLNSPLQLECQF